MRHLLHWLETHWVTPAYSGCLLAGLALFFFGAATNTMAGWLYVISGVILALLAIGAILPSRSLRQLRVRRHEIVPVSAGEALTVEVHLENLSPQPQTLLQVRDELPTQLGKPMEQAIEVILPRSIHIWRYGLPDQRRGVYRWQTIGLRTAAPLGLFWCQRQRRAKAIAVVYPMVLSLTQCPLVDEMGQDTSQQLLSATQAQAASEGLTRTLRPYRWGDSIRLVHWKTSARYGDLRVRELETYTGGQELVIALDTCSSWEPEDFEQAVVAAASLYSYARQRHLRVSLWTAATDRIQGDQTVLEALAATIAGEPHRSTPNVPLLWLSQSPGSLRALPLGSRWLLWFSSAAASALAGASPQKTAQSVGRTIQPDQPLQLQLQSSALSPTAALEQNHD
ncbi:DUF58 domain-containing protein [Phormidium tenue FACHB-886]|nr:DUF58 domain-containing protein [Phormidium tenue FACHB-886]